MVLAALSVMSCRYLLGTSLKDNIHLYSTSSPTSLDNSVFVNSIFEICIMMRAEIYMNIGISAFIYGNG